MSNITPLPQRDPIRVARAAFVKDAIAADDRSNRYVAGRIGINPTSLGDRLSGKVAFTAEDIEGIARVLKRDPVRFYGEYLAAGQHDPGMEWAQRGSNPRPTDYQGAVSLAPVTPITARRAAHS